METAAYRCQGCKHEIRLMINGSKECQRCGGTFERIQHPLMASNPKPARVIAYGSTDGERHYSESVILHMVDELMVEIYARLDAECELDRIENMWYNKEKGDPDGKEGDNANPV